MMQRNANTMQGGITTRNGSVLGDKNAIKQPLKQSRNALGDISNRNRGVGNGYGLAKKTNTTKPFSVATNTRPAERSVAALDPRPRRKDKAAVDTHKANAGPLRNSTNHTKPTTRRLAASQQSAASGIHKPSTRASTRVSSRRTAPSASINTVTATIPKRVPTVIHRTISAIDAPDMHKAQAAAEYASDIYAYHRSLEARCLASPTYMSTQSDINERMRAILIDWLIEVHYKFKLLPQTMYLCVATLDRFLERKEVSRKRLQLVGCTAMLVASKYEEIYAPELQDFVYISDKAFSRKDMLEMEGVMLNVLGFSLTVPISHIFATRFLKIVNMTQPQDVTDKTKHMVCYLLERVLQEYDFIQYTPSLVAASALLLAMRSLRQLGDDDSNIYDASMSEDEEEEEDNGTGPVDMSPVPTTGPRRSVRAMSEVAMWVKATTKHLSYNEESVSECMTHMKELIIAGDAKSLKAVKKKYENDKFLGVSRVPLV